MSLLAKTFGILGTIISLMVYFAPVPTFYQIYLKKSTEGFQSIPYVTSLFSALLWIYYAILNTNNAILITTNSVGCLMQITYICMYIFYATRDTMMHTLTKLVLPNTICFILIILLTQLLTKGGQRIHVVGWICNFFSLLEFAAPLCIVRKVIRTRSVKHMPFLPSLLVTVSAAVWFVYGIFQNDYVTVIQNLLGFIFGIPQLTLYFLYKNAKEKGEDERNEVIAIEDDNGDRLSRTRAGVVPPLATRATSAAWPPPSVNILGPIDGPAMESTIPLQANRQGFTSGISANDNQRQDSAVSASRNNTATSSSSAGTAFGTPAIGRSTQSFAVPVSRNSAESGISATDNQRLEFAVSASRNNAETNSPSAGTAFGTAASGRATQRFPVPVSRNSAEPHIQLPPDCVSVPAHIDSPAMENITPLESLKHEVVPSIPANDITRKDFTIPLSRDDADNTPSSVAMDFEEISVVNEFNHPFILSGDKETPFTYMASLSAKWVAMEVKASPVRGKIKCIVAGVKAFQYKERATYELRVYIDDGSLISEILIDHNVVQNAIGHLPEDVKSALASEDTKRVSDMKKTLEQFEKFLVNFEGMMLVVINAASPVPVAIELNEGCPESDAWLLLKRLKSSSSAQS